MTKYTALLATSVLAASLASCGAGEPARPQAGATAAASRASSDPAETVGELVERTQAAQLEAGSAHVEVTYEGEAADHAGLAGATSSGDIVKGETVTDTRIRMSTVAAGVGAELVLVDAIAYVNLGDMTGGKFVEVSKEDLDRDPTLAGVVDRLEAMDAGAQAEAVQDAVTAFEHRGTETVDGVTVDAYALTVNPGMLTGHVAGRLPHGQDLSDVQLVYLVGTDDLPVRSTLETEVDGRELTVSTMFSRWGEPVTIEAPPAEDTVSYSDMMR